MTDTKKIIEAAERHLEGTDLFVVECTSTPGNDIELTIDSDTSVGIDACAELSRAIEAELDREEEDFSLTVMSAGIGSELRSLRQYRKLVGRPAEVLLTNGVKILAKLDEATEEGITLSYEEKQAVSDQNIVTANGTGQLEFCRELLLLLKADTPENIHASYDFYKNGFVR